MRVGDSSLMSICPVYPCISQFIMLNAATRTAHERKRPLFFRDAVPAGFQGLPCAEEASPAFWKICEIEHPRPGQSPANLNQDLCGYVIV